MKSVHVIGLGMLVGALALGSMIAVMTYRWQMEAFPVGGTATPAAQPAQAAAVTGNAAMGKTSFESKCAGCHTIGGGKRTGPDLKGVTTQRPHDWLVNFIIAPDKVIASGDPTATALLKEYGMPMPNLGVSQTDAEAVLAYIAAQSGGAAPSPQAAAPLPPGNSNNGLSLFAGERPLANGGPPCLGCHNANSVGALGGGSWGLDLTHAITKTGAAGVTSIIKSPPFPGMTEAFASHPVSDSEAADLVAFLTQVDTQQTTAPPGFAFPLIGLGVLLLLAGLVRLAWSKRSAGVRRQLVGGRSR